MTWQKKNLKVATGTTVSFALQQCDLRKECHQTTHQWGSTQGYARLENDVGSSLLIVVCYVGKKYVLLQANVVHHLPLVS